MALNTTLCRSYLYFLLQVLSQTSFWVTTLKATGCLWTNHSSYRAQKVSAANLNIGIAHCFSVLVTCPLCLPYSTAIRARPLHQSLVGSGHSINSLQVANTKMRRRTALLTTLLLVVAMRVRYLQRDRPRNSLHKLAVVEAGGSQFQRKQCYGSVRNLSDTNPNVGWGFSNGSTSCMNDKRYGMFPFLLTSARALMARFHYARGKTLGGSTARIHMAYQRGTVEHYQRWADEVPDES